MHSAQFDERLSRFSPADPNEALLRKRAPDMNHKDLGHKCEWIFQALAADVPRGGLRVLASICGFKYSTIANWRATLRVCPNWRPSRKSYGRWRRAFTIDEEEQLLQRIQQKYLDRSLCYTDRDFQVDAHICYEECRLVHERCIADGTGCEDPRFSRTFTFSAHFAQDFRSRHAISLRLPGLKRRPTTTPEQIESLTTRVHKLLQRDPSGKIVNIDETNWKTVAAGFLT
jgi:hypothetical protein